MAGWYGNASTPGYLFPFAADLRRHRAVPRGHVGVQGARRVATAMHGMWGSFWMGYGLLQLLLATHVLHTGGTLDHALGFWFIALAAITFSGDARRIARRATSASPSVLGTLAAGSAVAAFAFLNGEHDDRALGRLGLRHLGGARVVRGDRDDAEGRRGRRSSCRSSRPTWRRTSPAAEPTRAIELEWGEPGVKMGQ